VRIILGIGNPGLAYASTRHNVGWRVLDEIAGRRSARWSTAAGPYADAVVSLDGADCALVKPLTYVNLSGPAASHACTKHATLPTDMLVVLDDVHLEVGEIRLRLRGSSGGHNGMESLIDELGTNDLPRLRVGIGAPGPPGGLVEHVLSPFNIEEADIMARAAIQAASIAEAFGRGGYEEAGIEHGRLKSEADET